MLEAKHKPNQCMADPETWGGWGGTGGDTADGSSFAKLCFVLICTWWQKTCTCISELYH